MNIANKFRSQKRKNFRLDYLFVSAILFAMALIAFANVFSRYLFHFSFAATEEITINLFVWMTVIGTGIAFERGSQLGMVTLYNLFPEKIKKAVILFSAAIGAALFIIVDIYMIQAIYDEITLFQAKSPGLGIPVWVYYTGVPVFSVYVFRGIYRNVIDQIRKGDDKIGRS